MNASRRFSGIPYLGLRPYEEQDHSLFFGREAQVAELLRQLSTQAFLAVVGSSGSGKSSLVRAGLIPAVRDGFLLGETTWKVVILKPGHQPYLRLLRELRRSVFAADSKSLPSPDAPATADEKLDLEKLLSTDRGLLNLLYNAQPKCESPVLLVVDQFEELFAFRRTIVNRESVASRDEAAAFVQMLLWSSLNSGDRVRVVVTMRSDFFGDCEAFLGLPEAISRSQFLVPRLDRTQMTAAIQRPGQVTDSSFASFGFEDGLSNRLINDAGDRPDQLPLLQHALMRMWKRSDKAVLTLVDYLETGGIEDALSRHADDAWSEIQADPRKALLTKHLFLLLCDVSPDGQITRRRPTVQEVMNVTGATRAEVEAIVRIFQADDRNFLLPPLGDSKEGTSELGPDTLLDISHEALLRRWRRFSDWQDQERQDVTELRRLVDLARLYRDHNGSLLPVRDLARITRWRDGVSEMWSRRYVEAKAWKEALAYVDASRAHAARAQSLRFTVGVLLVVATIMSCWQSLRANHAEKMAIVAANTARDAAYTAGIRKDHGEALLFSNALDNLGTLARAKSVDDVRLGGVELLYGDLVSSRTLSKKTLDIAERMKNDIKSGEFDGLRNDVLAFGRQCRSDVASRPLRFQYLLKITVYERTYRVLKEYSSDTPEMSNSLREYRFYQHYYGSMLLVETKQIEEYMVKLANVRKADKESIEGLIRLIEDAAADELKLLEVLLALHQDGAYSSATAITTERLNRVRQNVLRHPDMDKYRAKIDFLAPQAKEITLSELTTITGSFQENNLERIGDRFYLTGRQVDHLR